ncbi:MAG: hypothetical protein GY714_17125 [Desulfobacterales bacterium]|nr:hypothetical protein [Desulfobacterales bacterium]MCP4159173.1 hypothetical protein [Deltaproteobacteria bacterium]
MKNDSGKDEKNPNPFLNKFKSTINSKFDKASETLKNYNKKIDYSYQEKTKS